MAIVMVAGPPVASSSGAAPPFEIRKIEISDVMECIAEGLRDFRRAPKYGMFFGAIFAVGGILIVWAVFALDYPYLAYPCLLYTSPSPRD